MEKTIKPQQKHSRYSYELKIEAVQLAERIGVRKAAAELGIPASNIGSWVRAAHEGRLRATAGYMAHGSAVSKIEELDVLRERIKTLEREKFILSSENAHLRSVNDFLNASLREDDKESPAS